jgi:hypothetical protein
LVSQQLWTKPVKSSFLHVEALELISGNLAGQAYGSTIVISVEDLPAFQQHSAKIY